MRCFQRSGEIEITGIDDFDPEKIFECGQCFRWNPQRDSNWDPDGKSAHIGVARDTYVGVAMGKAARVRQDGGSIFISGTLDDFEAVWRGYFDLDRDYASIRQGLCIDGYMTEAVRFGTGIRILKQDKWEALCSFILSQCNNIPRIKSIIEKFCALFGEPLSFEGRTYYTFPTAEKTAALTESALAPIRCGFRAPALLEAARAVSSGSLDLEELALRSPEAAVEALKRLSRVGDKVASCAALFGLHMLDAFPIDTWIRKVLEEHYPGGLDPAVFSPHAGIAQQYMFYHMRCCKNRRLGK